MTNNSFDVLFLLARPGAGKSEVIDFLKNLAPDRRRSEFHLDNLGELDDFPMLWTWFEEDDIRQSMGKARVHSTPEYYFKEPYQWDLLIRRLGLDYQKILRDNQDYHKDHSLLVEFARGSQHGGFKRAFEHLSKDLIKRSAILYIDVSWEESLRKNRKRFNPDKPDSILEHGLEDEKLEFLYKESDWQEIAPGESGTIDIQGVKVPYAVMDNHDDVTSTGGEVLAERLKSSMDVLFNLMA
ncbi:MAG: hypothetical protein JEY99_14570 [Spirochaetales bacterium]|nr:hypothetical protein [Spirochaetales bacterium]